MEIAVPDGRVLRASAEEEPDLFWALRGGGGNFGAVTALEFRLHEVGELYAGALFFPYERSSEVLQAWHAWLVAAPEEVTSVGRLLQFPPFETVPEPLRGSSFAILEAAFLGGEAEGEELIAPLRELGPGMDTFAMVPPVGLSMLHMDPPEPVPAVTGHTPVGDLPAAAIEQLVAVAGPGSGSRLTSVELRQLGGALARAEPWHGALAAVPASFAMFAVGSPPGEAEAEAEAMRGQIARVADALAPHEAGKMLNFGEQPADTAAAFPAETYARLQAVRRAYDPHGLMHANHPIPRGSGKRAPG